MTFITINATESPYIRLGNLAVALLDHFGVAELPMDVLQMYGSVLDAMHSEDELYMQLMHALLMIAARQCGIEFREVATLSTTRAQEAIGA